MLPKTGLCNWFCGITGLILLSGCSFERSSEAPSVAMPPAWFYQKQLPGASIPDSLTTLTGGKTSISARCYFSPELVDAYHKHQKMILLPFLTPLPDGSFGPDFNGSLSAYEAIESHLNLFSTIESVQLYQRWVSSAEQACPTGLNRNVSQCSLKNFYSINKLWGGGAPGLYNFERLNRWLEQKQGLRFVILPSFNTLNSAAAQSLRYSANSAPIVKKSTSERRDAAVTYLGQASLDWVALAEKSHVTDHLVSAGHCSAIWQELETLKKSKTKIDYQKLVAADKAMRAVLLNFINDAFQGLDLKQN